jgi:hypothetical protein
MVSFEVVPPICEMGSIVLITVALLGCILLGSRREKQIQDTKNS